ncbi:MAG: hypothetical protein IMW86_06900 [Hydrogenibacillus sp.]|nr:hypothetical protein [Hydrogenibacillus sp.]
MEAFVTDHFVPEVGQAIVGAFFAPSGCIEPSLPPRRIGNHKKRPGIRAERRGFPAAELQMRLLEFAIAQGLPVGRTVKEIGSGLNGKRRELLKLLAHPNVTTIVVEERAIDDDLVRDMTGA